MTTTTTTTTTPTSSFDYSYVVDKTDGDTRKTLKLLQTSIPTDDADKEGIVLDVLTTSLSANNKFYVDFGDKAPFHFFKCYPVDSTKSSLVGASETTKTSITDFAHPPVWGICKVAKSNNDDVKVGTHYFAQLPMGEKASFATATIDKEDDSMTIHRPETNPAYNVFQKIEPNAAYLSEEYGGLAVVCFPGIVTGFGLYFHLKMNEYFGADTIVLTSASSKVSLALALYLKEQKAGKNVIGYTSTSNKDFCDKTGLYDTILEYDDALTTEGKVVMVDVAGAGKVYKDNMASNDIVKLLGVGNSSSTPEATSTFSTFSYIATLKMIMSMMGAPNWIRSWLNPTQELYLIFHTTDELKAKWGTEKYKATIEEYTKTFCVAASKWMSTRVCETEDSIETAYGDIMNGNVPPTEAVVLNVAKAVAHRKK
jgi:hypothetical protein